MKHSSTKRISRREEAVIPPSVCLLRNTSVVWLLKGSEVFLSSSRGNNEKLPETSDHLFVGNLLEGRRCSSSSVGLNNNYLSQNPPSDQRWRNLQKTLNLNSDAIMAAR